MSSTTGINQKILGYSDKLTVRPGDSIDFKISTLEDHTPYTAQLVRLINGDTQSQQSTFKEIEIEASFNGEHMGRHQPITAGSFIAVTDTAPLLPLLDIKELTLLISFMPTALDNNRQQLIGCTDNAQQGWSLYINDQGQLAFSISSKDQSSTVTLDQALISKQWYQAVVRVSCDKKLITLECIPSKKTISLLARYCHKQQQTDLASIATPDNTPLIMAGSWVEYDANQRIVVNHCFNGRLESPVIYRKCLSDNNTDLVLAGQRPNTLENALIADWDFSQGIGTTKIYDRSANQMHGLTYNLPSRAVTGYHWDGSSSVWTQKPEHYAAIHFHSDDLYDCGWLTDIRYQVDGALRSGVYAVRLQQTMADGKQEEEYLPFFVAPKKYTTQAKAALLLPTFTYLAYGNTQLLENLRLQLKESKGDFYGEELMGPGTEYYGTHIANNTALGLSTYDKHSDGSQVQTSSWLRPLLNMRPKSMLWTLGADLLLVDWLEHHAFDYDIITDDLVHQEGIALLKDYSAIITGNHPEYCTTPQYQALEEYLGQGGRLMYLGGNGFYWRSAVRPSSPAAIEVRRGRIGTTNSPSEIGESYLEFSGELGGLCREYGKAPQQLVGVGFVFCGDGNSSYYRLLDGARQGRAAFILEGVDEEIIGDFGIIGGGAAGQECDKTHSRWGTPEHTVIIARSEKHNLSMHDYSIEDRILDWGLSEEYCQSQLCAEIVFFETASGGAVFSVGSMTWVGSLGHNDYKNTVSTMTANVVKRFCAPEPFPLPEL